MSWYHTLGIGSKERVEGISEKRGFALGLKVCSVSVEVGKKIRCLILLKRVKELMVWLLHV